MNPARNLTLSRAQTKFVVQYKHHSWPQWTRNLNEAGFRTLEQAMEFVAANPAGPGVDGEPLKTRIVQVAARVVWTAP